jgi:hypothetical protein
VRRARIRAGYSFRQPYFPVPYYSINQPEKTTFGILHTSLDSVFSCPLLSQGAIIAVAFPVNAKKPATLETLHLPSEEPGGIAFNDSEEGFSFPQA